MKQIYYWSPCLNKVGTYKSTINSMISLSKYSNNTCSIKLINTCGEWDHEIEILKKYNIEIIDFGFKYFKFLPKNGFFKSRISYIIIVILSLFPLLKLIITKKPDFLVIHLLTSLPLLLHQLFNFKTKLILRISGYPKMNFLRKLIWRLVSKKLYYILCPSNDLKNQLIENKIFNYEKLIFIPDPIIEVNKFSIKRNKINSEVDKEINNKFFISAGRLTKQKNFTYLIYEFQKFSLQNNEFNLLIFGDGEEKIRLDNLIKKFNLQKRIFLMGHSEKLSYYMKKAEAFILSSLWEDPGFVLIESAMNDLFIISSDCQNGPREFLNNGKAGILYRTNKSNDLKESLNKFLDYDKLDKLKMKVKAKKNCNKYTLFKHFKLLQTILFRTNT